ncbi:MAG: hypothetical protein DRJ07_09610 [Bacteroidetes bacterium]|nr:MAG: hypothetical protein DRJ07_09610 [Bacteroidota bacterium]
MHGLAFIQTCIANSGKGILPELKDRTFDAFFTTKLAVGGNSLDLHIIKRIINKHKGTITFESKAGIRTSFKVFCFNL